MNDVWNNDIIFVYPTIGIPVDILWAYDLTSKQYVGYTPDFVGIVAQGTNLDKVKSDLIFIYADFKKHNWNDDTNKYV